LNQKIPPTISPAAYSPWIGGPSELITCAWLLIFRPPKLNVMPQVTA